MDIQVFKESFDALFLSELDILLSRTKKRAHNPHIHGLFEHTYTLARGGKRIRPYVMSLAYGASMFDNTSLIKNQLIGIELLHLFALIHDDIMDNALTRHGVESVNAFIEKQYPSSETKHEQGKHEAILVGDIVFSFACTTFSKETTPEILKLFYELIDEVIIGQMIDIRIPYETSLDEALIHERILLKTARYSFARPMQIGATLAHKSKEQIQLLFNLGEELGILFQITDDILDIIGEKEVTQKTPLQDLFNGQETFLTHFLKINKPEYYSKLEHFKRKTLTTTEILEVKSIFKESGALNFAYAYIENHKQNALRYIEEINDNKEYWEILLEKILHRKS